MDLVLVLVVLALIVLLVSAPLRRRGTMEAEESAELAELEAAREAKYREIRDAELDHRTGKLSDADYGTLNRELRAEAMELLRRLDELEAVRGARAEAGVRAEEAPAEAAEPAPAASAEPAHAARVRDDDARRA